MIYTLLKKIFNVCLFLVVLLGSTCEFFAQTVGVFYETKVPQIQFAAADIKIALEAKGYTVEMLPLSSLTDSYSNKKVVIALASNRTITKFLAAQTGTIPKNLGEQSYALLTTKAPQLSYWVLGGDTSGAMYGGFQIAENIDIDGLSGAFNMQETPFMLNRGMKLNMPLDRRIPTYIGKWSSNSTKKAIPNAWDMTFWKKLIDQQSRNRYNVLSIWVHHPFPALVKLADYPKVSLSRIEGFEGFVKELNHEQRVAFWREVMNYAHNRGMKVYFFNWNVHLNGAYGIDGLPDEETKMPEKMSSPKVTDYMYKSMTALLETYPELDGFGITSGDGMNKGEAGYAQNTEWTWNAMGKAVKDYLAANPTRKFNLIHREVETSPKVVDSIYAPLKALPNVTLNFSHKYAMAHMYSTTTPKWTLFLEDAAKLGFRSWLTIRNDDYFYFNWGDPKFVKEFLINIPNKQIVDGMYIGSDGYSPTRTYFCKDESMNGQLEVERRWYMEMLWGRMAYNPKLSDAIFKNKLAKRFPAVSSSALFDAWSLASRSLPKVTELVMGNWRFDYDWYPEGCWSDPRKGTGFRTIDGMANLTTVAQGSKLCDIPKSAADLCDGKKSSYTVADEIQADSEKALSIINTMKSNGNGDLEMAIMNVKQMASLGIYYSYKIRGATYKKAGKIEKARAEMEKAYCWWISYTQLMEVTYYGDTFRNHSITPNWKYADDAALKEYTDLGGIGTPKCK